MPELPEVECTASYLRKYLPGKTITGVRVLWPRSVATPGVQAFRRGLIGSCIIAVSRRGKFVIASLSQKGQQAFWLTHLRMSGYLEVVCDKSHIRPHDRIIISLSDGHRLHFHDVRKFGRMWLVNDPDKVTRHLGPEPLDPDFSQQDFLRRLRGHRGRIKPLLLNQKVLAGIGNIYADESLWLARIHPLSVSAKLSGTRLTCLYHALQGVLKKAIETHGTDSGDRVVNGGKYRPRVYGREGKACFRCHGPIQKIVVGQRGTHLCPACQRR